MGHLAEASKHVLEQGLTHQSTALQPAQAHRQGLLAAQAVWPAKISWPVMCMTSVCGTESGCSAAKLTAKRGKARLSCTMQARGSSRWHSWHGW